MIKWEIPEESEIELRSGGQRDREEGEGTEGPVMEVGELQRNQI